MKTFTFLIGRSFNVGGLFAILFAAGLNSSRAQDTWTQKADFAGGERGRAVGFSIGDKGYVGTGINYNGEYIYYKDFWEFDPSTNAWTQKANFGGTERTWAVGFSIGNKGYIGTGAVTGEYYNDFWEYDPATNVWTQKADFGGTARHSAVGFSIGGKGYIGTGLATDGKKNDFWEYNPTTNIWTQKANFGGSTRFHAAGFSIDSKGYIGTGNAPGSQKDFWEYDPSTDAWTKKDNFSGGKIAFAVGFSIGSKGYLSNYTDTTGAVLNDFWEYNPLTNTWTQKDAFGGIGRITAVGFSIGNKGYIGTGSAGDFKNDFWEYTQDTSSCAAPTNLSVTNITLSSAKLKWDAVAEAYKYKLRYKVTGSNTWTKITNISSTSKKILGLLSNASYTCQVKSVCSANPIVSSDWSSKQTFTTGSERLSDESLQQFSFLIYPNPADDHATIQFSLPQSSHVYIKVYDVNGKEIEVLLDAELQLGEHSLQLNTAHFSKGVYLVKMISDSVIENQKLIVQ